MKLINSFKSLNRNQKIFAIFFIIILFANSNITAINRGPCAVSTCFDVSDKFSDAMVGGSNGEYIEPSTYIFSLSNPIIAPSSIFMLGIPYEKEVSPIFQPFLPLMINFDNNPDYELPRSEDETWAQIMYLVTKIIILLSLPWWLFCVTWLVKGCARACVAFVVLLVISFFSLMTLFTISEMGATTLTWSWLF